MAIAVVRQKFWRKKEATMRPEGPIITDNCVQTLLDEKFIRVYDLQYAKDRHYYDATRRTRENLIATKSDEEFRNAVPDAVTIITIVRQGGTEKPAESGNRTAESQMGQKDRLLLSYEYRYPLGRMILNPPAGLIDPGETSLMAARRELKEETGIEIKPEQGDKLFTVTPLAFSSPGMTDECNALVCAVINNFNPEVLNRNGTEGQELFGNFVLLTKAEARKLLRDGRDEHGNFFSMYTWAALMYFVYVYTE